MDHEIREMNAWTTVREKFMKGTKDALEVTPSYDEDDVNGDVMDEVEGELLLGLAGGEDDGRGGG